MTAKEFAQRLGIREYDRELSKEEEKFALANGLVVIFGASDDLIELRGAIYGEFYAFNGGQCYVTKDGKVSEEPIPGGVKIEAEWNSDYNLPTWTYKTDIPHETFMVMDDGDTYCRALVFSLADVGEKKAESDTGLRPCPFCGGKVGIVKADPPLHRPVMNHPFHVECQQCNLFFGWDIDYGGRFDTEQEAAEAWNQRATD